MFKEIREIAPRTLMGMRIETNLISQAPQTVAMWRSFKPRVKEIAHRIENGFYSVQVYSTDFASFTPQTTFEKWAMIEVSSNEKENTVIPDNMGTLTVGGKYAVFMHKGLPQDFPKTSAFIFGEWLPQSGFSLDDRAHFEIIPHDAVPNDPNAEEEVWIPIK